MSSSEEDWSRVVAKQPDVVDHGSSDDDWGTVQHRHGDLQVQVVPYRGPSIADCTNLSAPAADDAMVTDMCDIMLDSSTSANCTSKMLALRAGIHETKVRVEQYATILEVYTVLRKRTNVQLDGLQDYCLKATRAGHLHVPFLFAKAISYDSTPAKK